MRVNEPITNQEYHLTEGRDLISKTDLQGKIVYANREFIEISGFSESELIGSDHSIVRHPHMPTEAFEDLWRTLKSGKPWRGMVKNRTKDGGFYWVEANANPLWEKGEVVGYISVRKRLSQSDKESAERIYKSIREGNEEGYQVVEGRPVKRSFQQVIRRFFQMSYKAQITLASFLTLLALPVIVLSDDVTVRLSAGILMASSTLLFWYLVRYRILTNLDEIIRRCQIIAAGDLRDITANGTSDEVSRLQYSVSALANNISGIVGDVRRVAGFVSGSTVEISDAADQISGANITQSASVDQTSASIEEISATINQNTENSKATSGMVIDAVNKAKEGGEAVIKTVEAMRRISEEIKVVDDIVYKTNLISLNASIEAARAGSYGKGFSVVADEIGKLADKSLKAAEAINRISSEGVDVAEQAGDLIDGVVSTIVKTSVLVQDISNASEEQALGVGQVNNAVMQLSKVTQNNAASSEQLAATAKSIEDQARILNHAMELFTVK